MPTFKLVLEYHGGKFTGWAVQPGFRTVEQALLDALGTVLGSAPSLSVAGRTDTGVHARGQVVSFAVAGEAPEPPALLRSLNGVLPHDVAVVAAEAAAGRLRRAAGRAVADVPLPRAGARRPGARSSATARCGGRIRSTSRRWTRAPRRCRARTTSPPSRPPRPSTCASSGTCSRAEWRRDGRICSSSGSRPTPSCGTWCGCWSGRCSRSAPGAATRRLRRLLAGAPRASAGPTAEPHGLCLESVSY